MSSTLQEKRMIDGLDEKYENTDWMKIRRENKRMEKKKERD